MGDETEHDHPDQQQSAGLRRVVVVAPARFLRDRSQEKGGQGEQQRKSQLSIVRSRSHQGKDPDGRHDANDSQRKSRFVVEHVFVGVEDLQRHRHHIDVVPSEEERGEEIHHIQADDEGVLGRLG